MDLLVTLSTNGGEKWVCGPNTYVQVLPYSHIIDDSSFTSRKVEVLCIVFVVVIAKDCDFFFLSQNFCGIKAKVDYVTFMPRKVVS